MNDEDIKAIVIQLDKTLTYPRKDFIKWLKSKTYIKHRYFSALIYYRAYRVAKELEKDYDHISVVTGLEGEGKSWFAAQYCAVISPTLSIDFICYSLQDFVTIIKTAKAGDSIMLDEGGQFLYSRQAMSDGNIITTKLLMLARQKNLHVCICIPSFYSIDSYIRLHRVKSLFYIPKRGQVKLIIKNGIKIISKEGSKYQTLTHIKLPTETFHNGYFAKKFPEMNGLNAKAYQDLKSQHLDTYINELESELKNKTKNEPDFISLKEFSQIVSVSTNTLKNWIKEGKIKAKKLGLKWYVHKDSTLSAFSQP